jgi:hypothetical protein
MASSVRSRDSRSSPRAIGCPPVSGRRRRGDPEFVVLPGLPSQSRRPPVQSPAGYRSTLAKAPCPRVAPRPSKAGAANHPPGARRLPCGMGRQVPRRGKMGSVGTRCGRLRGDTGRCPGPPADRPLSLELSSASPPPWSRGRFFLWAAPLSR